jgi:SAM-dependent methyltransferase
MPSQNGRVPTHSSVSSVHQSAPHHHREIAESFGGEAERYDRARPRYPKELAEQILAGLPGNRTLDVGIGTGLSAIPFREAGADVVGVEVDERMAEVARARRFEVAVASFEQWDAEGRQFDAVVSGQTWHWIDPRGGARKARDLLRPGGRFAAFWNVADPPRDVALAFAEVYGSLDTGLPFVPWARPTSEGYDRILGTAAEGLRETRSFSEQRRLESEWQAVITRDAWLEQVPTMGGHNRIPEAQLVRLLRGLGEVVDENGGSFAMHYTTVALVADRLSAG